MYNISIMLYYAMVCRVKIRKRGRKHMSNKKKILSLAIAVSMITSAFTSFAAPVNSKDSLFDVFDSGITMFDAENAGDSTVATTAPTATTEVTEATTAPTATAEAAEATTAPTATAEAAEATTAPTATAEATTAPTEAPTAAPTVDPSWDGSVDISENFDGESAVDGNGYKWDVVIGNDWGGTNKALSLTANDGKSILKVPNGMGSKTKDVKMTFKAGSVKSFMQNTATWDMVFKSTDGTELFKFRVTSGGSDWARRIALVVGDEVKDASYSAFSDSKYTDISAYVTFNENGGEVTLGNTTAEFASGSNIGEIAIEYDQKKDWDRPFFIDDFTAKTVDREKVTFNVKSNKDGESVEGATLAIGNDTYTVPANGKVEAYYLPGTYDYTLKLAKHKALTGKVTVAKSGETSSVYKFENIASDVNKATLVHAYYKADKTLDSVTTTDVDIQNGTYTVKPVEKTGCTEKYMLWDSTQGMKPVSTAKLETTEVTNDNDLVLEYVGEAVATRAELGGGEDYIYLPTSGTATSKAFTATIYDNAGLVMDNAEVEWSLPGQPDTISIGNDGVITLTPQYPLTDDNGVDVVVRATVKGTKVTAEKTIHIHNTARATTWDIAGPAVIKDGTAATYSVANVKDQYGNDFTGENTYTLTSDDAKAAIEGLSITPNVGTSRTQEVKLTVASASNPAISEERTVTVYGYDFYEPGTGEATYGTPRMETVNGVNSIVWPASVGGKATTEITLPTPVELKAGSAKMITFDNIMTVKNISAQERSLKFLNSEGTAVIDIDFAGSSVVKDYSVVDKAYTGTEIGKMGELGEKSSATFVLKTDASGVTSAILSYNGTTLAEYEVGTVNDIAKIVMTGGAGVPNERLCTLTNLVISDSDVAEVEIVGDSQLAKVSGTTATKTFKGSIFSLAEGETYTWSVADASGNPIDGVTIDQKGVLSVADTVAADTVAVVSYTSSLSTTETPKKATHEVTIKDFAEVKSFDIEGPVAVNAGDKVTYQAKNIIDQYGDESPMAVTYAITDGSDIATIDSATGVVTTTGKLGSYTVSVTVGNPGKTKTETKTATVAKYSESGEATGNVEVDVTKLANYAADTQYRVTTATADGVLVNQTETKSTDGKVTVDMTGAAKYEVSPIYSYTSVGNVAAGKTIPLCDGLYDFTFKKSNGTRADIFVNGNMVGQNVDQYGKGRATSGSTYTAKDVKVEGGSAVVTMKDNDSNMDSIVVKKAPSIIPRKTHVYILGDSLVSNYYGTFADEDGDGIPTAGDAQTGWGQVMDKFISSDLNVTNLAESGNYATGLQASTFPGVLANAKAGDYMIMECGYNDANYSSEAKMATALEEIADDCEKAGITLILSTPNFGAARGDTNKADVKFGPKILEVAKEKGVLGVNLSGLGYADYTASGSNKEYWSKNFNVYFSGAQQDDLHLSYFGAMKNASLVAQAIYDAQNDTENAELAETLKGLKINTQAYQMKDSEGQTVTLQVK